VPDLSDEHPTDAAVIGPRPARSNRDSLCEPTDATSRCRGGLPTFRRARGKETEWYWTVIDPMGSASSACFSPTAYCAHGVSARSTVIFPISARRKPVDLDRSLGLINDYGRLIDRSLIEPRHAQSGNAHAEPMPTVDDPDGPVGQLRPTLAVWARAARGSAIIEILRELENDQQYCGTAPLIARVAILSDGVALAQAPDRVGLVSMPTAVRLRGLVKLHTTLDLTPSKCTSQDSKRIAQIEHSMESIRAELASREIQPRFSASQRRLPLACGYG